MPDQKLFRKRLDGGMSLIPALQHLKGQHPLILALPRGGVVTGKAIADALHWPMDLILCKKVGHPENPEWAVGSVCADGTSILTYKPFQNEFNFDRIAKQLHQWLKARYTQLTGREQPISLQGKTVVLTDDGLATGSTMLAAIRSVRVSGAKRVVCAVPVSSATAAERVRKSADEFICTSIPEEFDAVGQFYSSFPEVTDTEVQSLLQEKASVNHLNQTE